LVLPTEGRSVHTISPDAGGGRLASCETLWTEGHKHSCK
jgi:hypothetical protein